MGVAPGIVVLKVCLEVVLGVEAGVWDESGSTASFKGAFTVGVGVSGAGETARAEKHGEDKM